MTRSPVGPGTTGQPWSRRRDPATCARHLSRATHAAAVARVGLRTLKKFNIEYIRMLLSEIIKELNRIKFTYIPLYKDNIENITGFISSNNKADFLGLESPSKNSLRGFLEDPLFIPENTSLSKQLANFQLESRRVGLIVDEYGDLEGLITLRDILEIIVGEITSDTVEKMDIMPQADGSFILEGGMIIRDINRRIKWDLPTGGAKTLSGLILETAQSIPESNLGISIGEYRFETVLIKDNVVKLARAQRIKETEDGDEE